MHIKTRHQMTKRAFLLSDLPNIVELNFPMNLQLLYMTSQLAS